MLESFDITNVTQLFSEVFQMGLSSPRLSGMELLADFSKLQAI
jgi:hypothetical protein